MFDGIVNQVDQRLLDGPAIHIQFDVGCRMLDGWMFPI